MSTPQKILFEDNLSNYQQSSTSKYKKERFYPLDIPLKEKYF